MTPLHIWVEPHKGKKHTLKLKTVEIYVCMSSPGKLKKSSTTM